MGTAVKGQGLLRSGHVPRRSILGGWIVKKTLRLGNSQVYLEKRFSVGSKIKALFLSSVCADSEAPRAPNGATVQGETGSEPDTDPRGAL